MPVKRKKGLKCRLVSGGSMSREERKSALRNALIDAAERIVALRGLNGMKARDIASGAGCSLGAIYTVFEDIDRLILTLGARTLARLGECLSSCVIPDESGAEYEISYLVQLSQKYLDFAAENRFLWLALFEHRMPAGRSIPSEMRSEQLALFAFIERPLENLRPDLTPDDRKNLARSLFSAVHGIIALGLEEKLTSMPMIVLRQQIEVIVSAAARGLITEAHPPKV